MEGETAQDSRSNAPSSRAPLETPAEEHDEADGDECLTSSAQALYPIQSQPIPTIPLIAQSDDLPSACTHAVGISDATSENSLTACHPPQSKVLDLTTGQPRSFIGSSYESSTPALDEVNRKDQLSSPGGSRPGASAVGGLREHEDSSPRSDGLEIEDLSSTALVDQTDTSTSSQTATVALLPTISLGGSNEERVDDPVPSNDEPTSVVQAELVAPPVEAYQVVIDEESGHLRETALNTRDKRAKKHDVGLLTIRWHNFLLVLCLCLAVITIVVPVAIVDRKQSSNTDDNVTNFSSGVASSPSPSPTTPYKCYTSTRDVLEAQQNEDDKGTATYIICPNTDIRVGHFRDASNFDLSFVEGDYPILPIRSNVVIQCGLDGRQENNCTLRDGFVHVLSGQDTPTNDGILRITDPVDNFTIRGMTFTGTPVNTGPFLGSSVRLSHPAENFRFEDCLWVNFSSSDSVIAAGRNSYQEKRDLPLEDGTISVTFSNCGFRNIVFAYPVLLAVGHNFAIENTTFENLSVSNLNQPCDEDLYGTGELCSGILYCEGMGSCSARNICLSNVEVAGPSFIRVIKEETSYSFEQLFWNGDKEGDNICELGVTSISESGENSTIYPTACEDIFNYGGCPTEFELL